MYKRRKDPSKIICSPRCDMGTKEFVLQELKHGRNTFSHVSHTDLLTLYNERDRVPENRRYRSELTIGLSTKNSNMIYFNVQLCGLSGRLHPVLHNIFTTQDAKKLRLHIKFLTCDFLCNETLSNQQPSVSPACLLCKEPVDTIEHILVTCRAMTEVRSRLYSELVNTVLQVPPTV